MQIKALLALMDEFQDFNIRDRSLGRERSKRSVAYMQRRDRKQGNLRSADPSTFRALFSCSARARQLQAVAAQPCADLGVLLV